MSKVKNHIEILRSGKIDAETLKELRKVNLLTPDMANAKTAKNQGKGYASYIMHLAPFKVSGFNMCPAASQGCAAACLNTAGRGSFDSIQQSRVRKTLYFVKAKDAFLTHLFNEIGRIERKAIKNGLKPVVRLNGTSDLPWENMRIDGKNVFETFPNVQFYDYTKVFARLKTLRLMNLKNYNVTFSASETNDVQVQAALDLGFNAAVVFDSIPAEYWGVKVIDGDAHDLRFTDPQGGYIVGLKAKGDAKKDTSGFVKITQKQAA